VKYLIVENIEGTEVKVGVFEEEEDRNRAMNYYYKGNGFVKNVEVIN
jgi:hypothetical protein